MIWKFITAMFRFKWAQWRGFETIAPAKVQEYREAWCFDCGYNNQGQCELCKCLILSKVMVATEQCPKKFWRAVWQKKPQVTKE